MANNSEPQSLPQKIYGFFASVKLSIVLILVLAAASVVGTLIPQDQPVAWHQARFGPMFGPMDSLKLFDLYHAWWFQLLLILLAVNLVVCSLKRFPQTLKVVRAKGPRINAARMNDLFKDPETAHSAKTRAPTEVVCGVCEGFLKKRFSRIAVQETASGCHMAAEKGRWTRLGAYVIHVGFLLVLLGGLLGSLAGYTGYLNLAEGQSGNQVELKDGEEVRDLPFTIRCNSFSVSYYPDGSVNEYRSMLSVIRDGKTVRQAEVLVNHPLRYEGINFFQSRYGVAAVKNVTFLFSEADSGLASPVTVNVGESAPLPGGDGTFTLMDFRPRFVMAGRDLGSLAVLTINRPGKEPEIAKIVQHMEGFDRNRGGRYVISITGFDPLYYTGLMVTRDPGVWVVYSGFIFIILGCMITFFMAHKSVVLSVDQKNGKTRVRLAGKANKNAHGFAMRLSGMAKGLFETLREAEEGGPGKEG